jgi:Fe-S cluster assembly protein SufD
VNALPTQDTFEIPSRRSEDWKYSDLRKLMREVPPESPAVRAPIQPGGPFQGIADAEIVIANGRLNWWPGDDALPEGIEVFQHTTPRTHELIAAMPVAKLTADRALDALIIVKIAGSTPRTVLVRWVSQADGTAHFGRVGFLVEPGANLTFLESIEGSGEAYFSSSLVELFVMAGGSATRVCVADEPPSAVSVASSTIGLSEGARFDQTVITSGAKLQRCETRIAHPGQGASVRLDGLYVLGGERHADITTVVEHTGVGGSTDQLTKGVVADRARGVFQGRITVDRGADKTDARMGHHALILSDRAEVDAKPELEIYADDVACAHGNSIGALDQDALFYAMSRGLPEPEARALLTEAFVGEVVDRIEHEGARDVVRAWVAERLGGLG